MINSVRDSTLKAKEIIGSLLKDHDAIECTFLHGKSEIEGLIINLSGAKNNPVVRIKSHTGKEYNILISLLMSINGIDKI